MLVWLHPPWTLFFKRHKHSLETSSLFTFVLKLWNTTFLNIFITFLGYPMFHNGVVVKKEMFKIWKVDEKGWMIKVPSFTNLLTSKIWFMPTPLPTYPNLKFLNFQPFGNLFKYAIWFFSLFCTNLILEFWWSMAT